MSQITSLGGGNKPIRYPIRIPKPLNPLAEHLKALNPPLYSDCCGKPPRSDHQCSYCGRTGIDFFKTIEETRYFQTARLP